MYAQEDMDGFMLEEITVTAEKREASLQKTPLSMTAVKGENIREMGKVTADEVLKDVPGVVVQRASRGFVISMRGLGSDLPPGVGESSVSTNFDGVYHFRAEAGTLGYYDLERVEVLRGPQGTLYGRNATAGVVNVVSKNPGDEFGGYGTVEIGTDSLLRMEGAVNVPVNNDFSARMAFVSINRDGFLSNGQDDAVGSAARGKVRYEPSEDVKIVLSTEYTKIGGHGPGSANLSELQAGNEYVSTEPETLSQDYTSYKISVHADVTAGPGVITFIPSYQYSDGIVWFENRDGEPEKSWDPLDAEAVSAELRYASHSDAKIQWVGGLYYYDQESGILGNGNPTEKTDMMTSYAAFGQVTIPITAALRGIAGARIAYDEKSYHNISLDPSTAENDWTAFDWKLGLEYDLSEDVLAYLTMATGHRPGGFNSFALAGDLVGTTFEPEELVSAEIGIKSRFVNNRVQVNADVFYYDYEEYQVSDFYTPDGEFFPVMLIYNASVVENYGAELETEMLLTQSTIGKFSLTYLSSEYQDEFTLHGGSPPYPMNLKGYRLPHAPEWSAKFGLEHTFHMGMNGYLTPSVDVRWTDDQYVGVFPADYSLQEAYTIYDAALRYAPATGDWSINMYVKNAGDEAVVMGAGSTEVSLGSPRQAGIVFSAKF